MFETAPQEPIPVGSNALSTLIDDIVEHQWGLSQALFSDDLLHGLREEALTHLAEQRTHTAGIGKDKEHQQAIRKTHIKWLDEQRPSPTERELWHILDSLREALRRECYLSLVSVECHYAIYPEGAFYKRHLDQFHADTSRMISFILYLNPDWQPAHGGSLRLFLPDGEGEISLDIPPKMGHFVVFRSAEVEHEVCMTTAQRICVVGWMKARSADFRLP